MKKITPVLSLCLLLVTLNACAVSPKDSGNKTITRNVAVTGRTISLVNSTAADIQYREGSPSVKITGPANAVNKITIKEKGTTLDIGAEPMRVRNVSKGIFHRSSENVKIIVTLPALQSVTLQGPGDLTASLLTGTMVTLKSVGSGDLNVTRIESSSVKITSGGSGDCKISAIGSPTVQLFSQGSGDIEIGSVESSSLKAYVQGSGDLDIKKLMSSVAEISVQGSGDAEILGLDVNTLRASTQGTGDIKLSGSAGSATLTSHGVGDIDATRMRCNRISKNSAGLGTISN